jgi:two-component system, CitB family, response regulator
LLIGVCGAQRDRTEAGLRIADRLSAVDVAERVGIIRATAQRCLSSLAHAEVVRLELNYGSTGRPEHR